MEWRQGNIKKKDGKRRRRWKDQRGGSRKREKEEFGGEKERIDKTESIGKKKKE